LAFSALEEVEQNDGPCEPLDELRARQQPEKSGVRNEHLLPPKTDCDSHVGMLVGLRYSPGRTAKFSSVGPFAGYGDERLHPNTPPSTIRVRALAPLTGLRLGPPRSKA
jgi:hypothetical protein